MNTEPLTVSTDEALQILSEPKRRRALRFLDDQDDGRLPIHELAVAVADDHPSAQESHPELVRRIRTELHHVHLPKLASAGLVRYDSRGHTVHYRSYDAIEELLEFAASLE